MTTFERLQTGDIRDGEYGDMLVTRRLTLGGTDSATSAAATIRGEFELIDVQITVVTAINASAKTITVGTSATAARFVSQAVSAGGANEIIEVAPASASVPNWVSTGSAQGTTKVVAQFTDASGAAGTQYVTLVYAVRSLTP